MNKIVSIVEKHIGRVLPSKWWRCLEDPRMSRKCRWHFGYLMEVALYSMLSGSKTLREVEVQSELYDERVPDTTMHDFLSGVEAEPLQKLLAQGVKEALRSHELEQEHFPVRIIAIDGKAQYTSSQSAGEMSQLITGGGEGLYRNLALRAMYVSGETKLYLGQHEIPGKTGESPCLLPFIDQLLKHYGRTSLMQVVSLDAGIVSIANANGLKQRNIEYIMALKGSQVILHELGKKLLGNRQRADYRECEKVNGKKVERKLYRAFLPQGYEKWTHLQEVWRVYKRSTCLTSGEVIEEDRYFMTSLPPEKLSNKQVLQAVRMHWGIENNGNWCFDTAWDEDFSPWTSKALKLVAYLRMLAYNVISRLKTRRLRAAHHKAYSWKHLMKCFEHALCRMRYSLHPNTETSAFL